jgi:hypothetical protein
MKEIEGTRKFTTSKLVEFLNEAYGEKKTGKPFSSNDIQQYLRRGKLPVYAGGHPIQLVENEDIGTKLIEVDFSTKAERKPKRDGKVA